MATMTQPIHVRLQSRMRTSMRADDVWTRRPAADWQRKHRRIPDTRQSQLNRCLTARDLNAINCRLSHLNPEVLGVSALFAEGEYFQTTAVFAGSLSEKGDQPWAPCILTDRRRRSYLRPPHFPRSADLSPHCARVGLCLEHRTAHLGD